MTNSVTDTATDVPVRKTTTVKASVARAFQVFTDGFDIWWPRSHHIGKSPMQRAVLEGRPGGRCYSEHEDGKQCDWASILVWEPPQRLVLAWQISPSWQYEPDVAKSSEVEVRFNQEADNRTRVDLEHRYFARHGAGGDKLRTQVDEPGGWADILEHFAASAAPARLLSSDEIARADSLLSSTKDDFLSATSGLSAAQWSFKPSPDRWSIAEIAEHVVIVENRVHSVIHRMPNAPAAKPDRDNSAIEEVILTEVPRRSRLVEAPMAVVPQNAWEPAETIERFQEARAGTLRLLLEAPALRGHVVPHPILGPWDGYQWILGAGAHAARHMDQIAEVKACAGFPQPSQQTAV